MPKQSDFGAVSRRDFTHALLGAAAAPALASALAYTTAENSGQQADNADELFAELDEMIRLGMKEFAIPGAAVGVIYKGREFVKAYGVTDVRHPGHQVDANIAFVTASISKPVTGTAAMRLVEMGKLDLDSPVTSYIKDFQAPTGAEGVTVRQLLNHSAGWEGDDQFDTGDGDDALALYVDAIHRLISQQTPVGLTFAYNNAAIGVAGRVIEEITGQTFESSVQSLVLDPLGMTRSSYFLGELGTNVAVPHAVVNGKPVATPEWLYIPRNENSFGGLRSSVTDLLSFARFHLGNGRAANGKRVMSAVALRSMWSQPGPSGTLTVDLKGMGVAWSIRPTIEGVSVVEHGGDWPGYRPFLQTVPEKQFAMVLLNNSDGGNQLRSQLLVYDWALRNFAGVHNLPASPVSLSASELAQYEGDYLRHKVDRAGKKQDILAKLRAVDGGLKLTLVDQTETTFMLRFFSYDHVFIDPDGIHADFLRDTNGQIKWFRLGRLHERLA